MRCLSISFHCPRKVLGPPNHTVPTLSRRCLQCTNHDSRWVCHTSHLCRRQEPMELIQEPGTRAHMPSIGASWSWLSLARGASRAILRKAPWALGTLPLILTPEIAQRRTSTSTSIRLGLTFFFFFFSISHVFLYQTSVNCAKRKMVW